MSKVDPADLKPVELEKSSAYLLEAIVDLLAAAGPPFQPAWEDLKKLLASSKLLDPDTVKRHAFNLANELGEIKLRLAAGQVEIKTEENSAGQAGLKTGEKTADHDVALGGPLAEIIDALGALRPGFYQDQKRELLRQLRCEPLGKFLPALAAFAFQIREDIWAEKTSAVGRFEEILQKLEETEICFVESVAENQSYLKTTERGFTEAMADGLQALSHLIEPDSADLEILCRRISKKVNHIHAQVQLKNKTDQARIDALDLERRTTEKRLEKTRRDYEEFTTQSHEMLREIEALRTISLHDPLTGIYNRRAYDSQIAATIAAVGAQELKTVSLAVFDIDRFRDFNNTYGHLAGDRVLTHVARVASETLRSDDLFFRYGGDEFAIIMPNAIQKMALKVAEKVRLALSAVEFKVFKNSSQLVRVTVSMGVTEIAKNDDPTLIFSRADQALYAAKKAGRNRIAAQPALA